MTDDRTLPPDREKQIEDELRALSSPPPDAGFQASLRSRFAAGELESTLPGDLPGSASAFGDGDSPHTGVFPETLPREATDAPPILDFAPRSGRRARPAWRMWLVPGVAAAAAILLFFVRPTPPEVASLEVLTSGSGQLRIGEHEFPIEQVDQFRRLLEPGTLIAVLGDMSTEIQMRVADDFTLVAIAGAEFTVPQPPEKGRMSFRVNMGEVRVATRPGLAGEPIEIGAPGTRVDVMGTTLAVIADPSSTCVCLLDGTAMMMMKDGGMAHLDPGMRRVMHMDPSTPDEIKPILGNERMKLEMLRTAVGPSR